MGAFTEKGLQALNQAWLTEEEIKYDAERSASIADAAGDQYALAQAYTDYSDAENRQINLQNSYQLEERRATQQNVLQPIADAAQLQRDVWQQMEVQPGQPHAEGWNRVQTHRWKLAEAVNRGQISNEQAAKLKGDHVP